MLTTFIFKPRPPFVNRSTDTGILKFFAFSSKGQYIRNKHFWNAFFIMQHIDGSVSPCYLRANRRFCFTNTNRNSIYQINQIQTFTSINRATWKFPLIGYDTIIFDRIFAKESDRYIFTILSKGLCVFIK